MAQTSSKVASRRAIFIGVIVAVAIIFFFIGFFVAPFIGPKVPIALELVPVKAFVFPPEVQVYHDREICYSDGCHIPEEGGVGAPLYFEVVPLPVVHTFPPRSPEEPVLSPVRQAYGISSECTIGDKIIKRGTIIGIGQHIIKCQFGDLKKDFTVTVERDAQCLEFPDVIPLVTNPGTVATICGENPWVEHASFVPLALIWDGDELTVKSAGLSANFTRLVNKATFFNSSLTASTDSNRIDEEWGLKDGNENPVSIEPSSLTVVCEDDIPVEAGSIICNRAKVTQKSGDFVVEHLFNGTGMIKPNVTFSGDGRFIPVQNLTLQADNFKILADGTEVLVGDAAAIDSVNDNQPMTFALVKDDYVVSYISQNATLSNAKYRFALEQEDSTITVTYEYGQLDEPNFAAFDGSFEIDPTYYTGIAVQTTYYTKSSGSSGGTGCFSDGGVQRCVTQVSNGTTMSIGEQDDPPCTTGGANGGDCILRAISKWDISSVTDIPTEGSLPNQIVTGSASIKILYSTGSSSGSPSSGRMVAIMDITQVPSTSETSGSTLNSAWGDAGSDSSAYISSWSDGNNENHNCIVRSCPELVDAVSDYRSRQTGSWFAVGFENDDGNFGIGSDTYRTVNGLGYTGSNQKPKLKISYTCNNGSLNPGCT